MMLTGCGARALVKIYNDSTKSTDPERDVYFLLFDGGGVACVHDMNTILTNYRFTRLAIVRPMDHAETGKM